MKVHNLWRRMCDPKLYELLAGICLAFILLLAYFLQDLNKSHKFQYNQHRVSEKEIQKQTNYARSFVWLSNLFHKSHHAEIIEMHT